MKTLVVRDFDKNNNVIKPKYFSVEKINTTDTQLLFTNWQSEINTIAILRIKKIKK